MNLQETIRRILREESEKTPKSKMEKLIEKMGLMSLIHSMGLENILDTLEITKEELYQKYNPFKKFFTDEEFNTEFYDTIKYFSRPHFYDIIKKKSSEETLDFIISGIIDSFHSRLINFDTEDWIIPNTPKLLKMIYGDRIKNDPKYIKMVYLAKNLHEDFTDYGDLSNPEKLQKDFDKYIDTKTKKGVGKIHSSVGDNLNEIIKMLKKDFNFNNIEYAGEGFHGITFIVDNDKAIKLTNNEDEIRGIENLVGEDIPGVIHYYDIKEYPKYNMYAILMDKIDLLPEEQASLYSIMASQEGNFSDSQFWIDYDENQDELIQQLSMDVNDETGLTIDDDEIIEYIDSYRELVYKLEENGVSTEDLHGENIGKINDELVHFDIMKF